MCRIVSYNLHSGIGTDKQQDYRRIGSFLRKIGADIVLLQEMDTRPPERDIATDIEDLCTDRFTMTAAPTVHQQAGWFGNAVLSRFPVQECLIDDNSVADREPRNIQQVLIDSPAGLLSVVNVHAGLKAYERAKQIARISEVVTRHQQEPQTSLVLAGDLNEWRPLPHLFASLNNQLTQHNVGATFPSYFPLFKLDRLWTSPNLPIKQCQKWRDKGMRKFSDHLPIVLDLDT